MTLPEPPAPAPTLQAHAASSAPKTEPHGSAICVGDMISLFVEDLNGFVSADGFTEDSLNVKCLRSDEICVPRFESCVFQVQVEQNYHTMVPLVTFPIYLNFVLNLYANRRRELVGDNNRRRLR